MKIEININDRAGVVLTTAGANAYNKYWDQSNVPIVYRPKKLEFGDELDLSLWELFQIFGSYVSLGMPEMLFADNRLCLK